LKVSSIEIEIFQKINGIIIGYILAEIVKPPEKLQPKHRTHSTEKKSKHSKSSTASDPILSGI